ncbi:glycosyltransferase [Evansella tamaricis]|uniref:Glycosyltransferase n=1 Tax=Evansella tamaricis TaxID=2069301 RepID=A0ABS6JKX7_9BACI|nr:glycosyltransferase [Evansella tamaricis]MBU9712943.1 glycosyltransferase [Evansella tamaricis]
MKKVKILFYIYQMGAGGAARTLLNIINNLDRSKFIPVLVTLNFDGSYEKEVKEDVVFIKLPTKRLSKSIFQLSKIIRDEQIDIVFSTIPRVNTIAIVANKLSFSKAKNVIREADNLGGTWKTNLQLLGFGLVYKLSSQIVSLSEGVKDNLIKRYKIKPKDIEVIYNPVDVESITEKISSGRMNPEDENLFDTTDKIIITAGRLVEQKDQKTLLSAFAKVNQEIPSRLIILGEGPLEDKLKQQAKELNVFERVHFIGFKNNPYIYFQNADLFVLSSIHEGFSHVIAEALATGTPVVSTDCLSGPSEVLNKGEYGDLCEVGNIEEMAEKMTGVLSLEENNLEKRIAMGYTRAQHFDAKKIVKEYESIFLNSAVK